jgi:hypothetical protein
LVLDAWRDQPPTTYTFYVDGLSGLRSIFIEYYNDRSIGTATVEWSLATTPFPIRDFPPPPPIDVPPIEIISPPPPKEKLPPAITPVTSFWVDGTGKGGLTPGLPPAGWVQDPYGGAWYPPDHPYVLRNFDRDVYSVLNTNPPTETVYPVLSLAPPPPPPPPQVFIVEEPVFFNDFSTGGDVKYGNSKGFTLEDQFLI